MTTAAPQQPAPRWFWALPFFALLLWWPIDSYWQSDDFLALHYAQDLGRALSDFAGPQYGATDVWLFYRPLITLSFWLDLQLGGTAPFVAHLSNVLAHALSALLLGMLLRRWLGDGRAFVAALLWSALPSHVGTIAWTVGRVDGHTTVWCLAALLTFVRQLERSRAGERAARWPAVVFTALALCSKELAFAVPPLAMMLAWLTAPPLPSRQRAVWALRAAWPLLALLLVYFVWRYAVLGRMGGYLAGQFEPIAMARGLAVQIGNVAVPWRWAPELGGNLSWLALVPVVLAAGSSLFARPRLSLALLALFLVSAAPMAAFFADANNTQNLRYFYLPSMALAALLCARSMESGILVLFSVLMPLAAVREAQWHADTESRAMHEAMLREAADGAPAPMFVAGLPHQRAKGTTLQLHFGVDRMLRPPFAPTATDLYALRPIAELPGVVTLWPPDELPFALPTGSTWFFADSTALGRVPERTTLPELHVTGDADGVLDFSTPRLLDMTFERIRFGLSTSPGKPQAFRLTLFTATGYLACLFADHGPADATHGTIDARKLLAGDGTAIARYGLLGPAFLGEALPVPTTLDLDIDFPTLVEAGVMQGTTFVPQLRARRLLTFRFDRGYAAWVRLVQGKS